jgi:hypothetical protein
MPHPNTLGTQIKEAFDSSPSFTAHRSGHTEKLLRYQTATGIPFAIRRDVTSAGRFWAVADNRFKDAIEAEGFECGFSEPNPKGKSSTGRTSNLDQIPEFKGKPLHWTTVTTPAEALAAASKLR